MEQDRISGRLKDALVADVAMDDLSELGDQYLARPVRDPEDWTDHFARQLELQTASQFAGTAGLHHTLLFLLRMLDDQMRDRWPPPHDISDCTHLVNLATRSLTPIQLHATLLCGPEEWRRRQIDGCRIGNLGKHLQPTLEKALASQLHKVLERWVNWDIPKLAQRRREAKRTEEERLRAANEAAAADARQARPRKGRDPKDLQRYRPPPRI